MAVILTFQFKKNSKLAIHVHVVLLNEKWYWDCVLNKMFLINMGVHTFIVITIYSFSYWRRENKWGNEKNPKFTFGPIKINFHH